VLRYYGMTIDPHGARMSPRDIDGWLPASYSCGPVSWGAKRLDEAGLNGVKKEMLTKRKSGSSEWPCGHLSFRYQACTESR
jgi:hypothetical protein